MFLNVFTHTISYKIPHQGKREISYDWALNSVGITWTNAVLLSIDSLGTNFFKIISIIIQQLPFGKTYLKLSPAKRDPFWSSLNALTLDVQNFWENIQYNFQIFLNTEMAQLVEIAPHARPEFTYPTYTVLLLWLARWRKAINIRGTGQVFQDYSGSSTSMMNAFVPVMAILFGPTFIPRGKRRNNYHPVVRITTVQAMLTKLLT